MRIRETLLLVGCVGETQQQPFHYSFCSVNVGLICITMAFGMCDNQISISTVLDKDIKTTSPVAWTPY